MRMGEQKKWGEQIENNQYTAQQLFVERVHEYPLASSKVHGK